jgi:hypothetical protein
VRRQCARPGCSAIATATFTFDARELTVWLDDPRDGAARAGELCERHTRGLSPPQGWRLDDRRGQAAEPSTPPVAPPVSAAAPGPGAPAIALGLQTLLHARTPLLSRAFEAAGGS